MSDGPSDMIACFEVELADPPECVATLSRDGVEDRVLGPCELDPATLCWRIESDLVACPLSAHHKVVFENVSPSDAPGSIVIECVVADML